MVPYPIFQCLLLSYISGQATAGFFPSFGLRSSFLGMKSFKFNMKPIKFEMPPIKFEMPPLKFDNIKFKFNENAFKPLLKNENVMSGFGSPGWKKTLKSEVQETNFGGSANNGKLLPPLNGQQLERYNIIRKYLASGEKKAEISQKGKNDSPSPTDIHHEGSAGKAKESNLDSLKNSGKDLSLKNGKELGPSETNRKKLKVETPDKDNDHHEHIHIPEGSEKTNESFSMSFKQNGGHLSYKNNQELDVSKTSVKGLKEENPEKVKNIPHQESSDDDNSKKIKNLKHKDNLFLALNQNPDTVTSTSGSFVMLYLIIFITIVITLFICFKKCKKNRSKEKNCNNPMI